MSHSQIQVAPRPSTRERAGGNRNSDCRFMNLVPCHSRVISRGCFWPERRGFEERRIHRSFALRLRQLRNQIFGLVEKHCRDNERRDSKKQYRNSNQKQRGRGECIFESNENRTPYCQTATLLGRYLFVASACQPQKKAAPSNTHHEDGERQRRVSDSMHHYVLEPDHSHHW